MKTLFALAAMLAVALPASAAELRVTSAGDGGEGSLRAAIEAANDEPGTTIRIALRPGDVIEVDSALPAIRARGTVLTGGGTTIREGEGCARPGGRAGCDGIAVEGPNVTVRDLVVAGFTFDGVSVRRPAARDVRIERVQAIDNLDDGIGISDGAGPVTIERCLSMGNGYRTKGKGVLIFDGSSAEIHDSVMIANRDGITVSRDADAKLDRVLVAGSYDKGVGISGGSLRGSHVEVLASGAGRAATAPVEDIQDVEDPPNADGLRVGLGGTAELRASRIAGSGDCGVVVLDTSSATLDDTSVEANRGCDFHRDAKAQLVRDGKREWRRGS